MVMHRGTEPGRQHPPAPGDEGYEIYIPEHFDGLKPLKRLAPYSQMSCVFLMQDMDREEVILKMPAGLRMAQAEQTRWIRNEIDALRAFRHAFAPVLLADGVDDYGIPWFTLKFIEGDTLDRILGRYSLDRALELILELCDVVAALHRIGLVHRDIKPENVMVAQDDHIRLIDFGLAGPPGKKGSGGTPPYAPAEQGTDREQTSTDVYSLGLVLYELITGSRAPVSNAPDHRKALRSRIRRRLLGGLTSPWLTGIVLRCLRENPERRFADAQDLEQTLRGYVKFRRLRHLWTLLAILATLLGFLSWQGLIP